MKQKTKWTAKFKSGMKKNHGIAVTTSRLTGAERKAAFIATVTHGFSVDDRCRWRELNEKYTGPGLTTAEFREMQSIEQSYAGYYAHDRQFRISRERI